MSNRIILFERVLNSFVQPTHSGVPPLLLSRVMPYKVCLSGFALLCHCLESTPVIQHQLNPWRTLSVTACAFFMLLLVWWCPSGTFLHQSHSLFSILHRRSVSLYMQLLSLPASLRAVFLSCSCNKGTHPEMRDSRSSVHVPTHTLFFAVFVCPSYWFLADLSFYRNFSWLFPALQASVWIGYN